MTYRIKNWKRFQHFKDRRPPWVKLYRDILDQPDIMLLSDCAFRVLVLLWLLASEDQEGEGTLPDIDTISFRLRVEKPTIIKVLQDLSPFVYQDDNAAISPRYQVGPSETEGETETEGDIYTSNIKVQVHEDDVEHNDLDFVNGKIKELVVCIREHFPEYPDISQLKTAQALRYFLPKLKSAPDDLIQRCALRWDGPYFDDRHRDMLRKSLVTWFENDARGIFDRTAGPGKADGKPRASTADRLERMVRDIDGDHPIDLGELQVLLATAVADNDRIPERLKSFIRAASRAHNAWLVVHANTWKIDTCASVPLRPSDIIEGQGDVCGPDEVARIVQQLSGKEGDDGPSETN